MWLESWRGPAHRAGLRAELPPELEREDLIYGETPLWTAYQLLRWGGLQSSQTFCEIGCGRGVTSLLARLVFGARSCGYEALPELADKARWLARALELEVDFVTQSTGPYPAADLYYLTPTTWSSSNWESVQRGLEQAPTGCQALLLTQPLPDWKLIEKRSMPYSWGWSQTYLMIKP